MKLLFALACLFCSSIYANGKDWVTVKIDSLASIQLPDNGRYPPHVNHNKNGALVTVYDSLGSFMVVTFSKPGLIKGGPYALKSFYQEYVNGQKTAGSLNIVVKDFHLHGLQGIELEDDMHYKGNGIEFTRPSKLRYITINGVVYLITYSSKIRNANYFETSSKFLESFDVVTNEPLKQFDGTADEPEVFQHRRLVVALCVIFSMALSIIISKIKKARNAAKES